MMRRWGVFSGPARAAGGGAPRITQGHADGRRGWLLVALAVSAAVLAYGNGVAAVSDETRDRFLLYTNAAMVAAMVGVFLAMRVSASELGLAWRGLGRDAALGLGIGLGLATVPVLFILLAPFVTGEAVRSEAVEGVSAGELALRAGVLLPLQTALPEEVLHRGVVFAAWMRAGGIRAAVVMSALVFALWHVVISLGSVQEAEVVSQQALVLLGYGLALAALFVGGAAFALLRWRTGSVAAPAFVHWSVVAAMYVALWARG
jgi:membrane protease YdiL (CAAX protease family)